MNGQILLAFGVYFSFLLTIGLFAHRRNTTAADFMVGGRSLNFWITALSAHASDMSSWLFMAFPMAIYSGGLPRFWIAVGLVIGMFLNWHFVAPKLRIATEKFNSYTLSDFLESRFQDHSGVLRALSALMLLFFITCYLASGLIAMGRLFESLFHLNEHIGIAIATTVVVAYTFMGGFVAVAWTDFFQGIFLLGMIIFVPCIAYSKIDGLAAIQQAAAAKNLSLSLLPSSNLAIANQFLETLAWSVGYFGLPHVLTKFMGISDPKEMYKAKYLGITWQILTLTAAAAIGLIGIAYFADGIANDELVFVEMVQDLFSPLFAGLILCGVLAATISTMDSQILVLSGVLAEDFYKKLWHKTASATQLLKASRVSVVLITVVALLVAYTQTTTIYAIVFYAWSGLGSTFGPLMLAALHAKRVNRAGAIAGLIVGGGVSALWPYANAQIPIPIDIPPMLPGFTLSLVAIFGVSRLARQASRG